MRIRRSPQRQRSDRNERIGGPYMHLVVWCLCGIIQISTIHTGIRSRLPCYGACQWV